MNYDFIKKQDEDVYGILQGEENRESFTLELIPSENYASKAVREAMGSLFTNKYSEGYPGKRYYGGQEFTDKIETVAIDRAKKLFNAEYANVQPLGGANANIALYFALLNPGDTILGMDLSHGGHLTHGHPITYISKIFNFVRYGMKDISTGEIDYDELRKVAHKEKPKIILAGFSAFPRSLDYGRIAEIAREVDAYSVMDAAHIAGMIASGSLEHPFAPHHGVPFDVITSTTHKTLRGPRGGLILTRESKEIAQKIDKAVFPGLQGGPHMHTIAAKAIAFKEALHPSFKLYTDKILANAQAMATVFSKENIEMITGGTSNHLILIDVVKSFNITGKEAQQLLDEAGIATNMNMIPNDSRSPLDPSGLRIGTPAITTRGFDEEASRYLAQRMVNILSKKESPVSMRETIKKLCMEHPIPEIFI